MNLMELWHKNHHLWEAYFWVIFAIPVYLWWSDSILLVLFISLYANYKTAIGAHEGRQARRNTEESNGDV